MPLDTPAFVFKRSELRRFITLCDFFAGYAGIPNQELVAEFDRLRPEFHSYIELFKQQVGEK